MVREESNSMSGLRDLRGMLANNLLLPFSVMLFLHGQGGRLAWQVERWQYLREAGAGVLAESRDGAGPILTSPGNRSAVVRETGGAARRPGRMSGCLPAQPCGLSGSAA